MGFLLYILILLTVTIFVALLRVSFDVDYRRREQDDNLTVKMSLLRGLVHYKTEVPTIELENRFFTPVLKAASEIEKAAFNPVEEKELKVKISINMRLIRSLPSIFKETWQKFEQYNSSLYYLFRFIRCRQFYWRTEIGLSDAAYTGIMVGLLWGIKSFLYKNFRSKIRVMEGKPAILVVPDYFHQKLTLDFSCIFDIRIGHIIIAGLNFVRSTLRSH